MNDFENMIGYSYDCYEMVATNISGLRFRDFSQSSLFPEGGSYTEKSMRIGFFILADYR